MYERLAALLLHPRLREGQAERRVDGHVLVWLLVSALSSALFINLYALVVDDQRVEWAHLMVLVVVGMALVFTRVIGTERAVLAYFVGASWAVISVVVVMTGGALSSAIYYYALVPFFGAALGARRGGAVGATLAFAAIAVLYGLHWAGVALPSNGVHALAVDPPSLAAATMLVYVVSASFVRARRSARTEAADATRRIAAANTRADAARAELERAQAAKAVALNRVGGGLHVPLARISQAARRLADELPSGLHDHAAMVARSAEQLLGKLDAFELYATSWDTTPSAVEPIALEQLLGGIVVEHAPDAASKGIALAVTVAAGCRDPRVGNVGWLRRIIAELVDNAVKFTAAGAVEITATPGDGDDGQVVIAVRDTGAGIPEGDRERIFEPLFRGDVSTTRRHGGTGLGLAVARRLAHGLGGALSYEPCQGEGARMVLRLALRPAEEGEA